MCECEKVHRLWKIDRHYLQNSSLSSSIIQKKTFLCSLRSQMKFNKNSNCEASKELKISSPRLSSFDIIIFSPHSRHYRTSCEHQCESSYLYLDHDLFQYYVISLSAHIHSMSQMRQPTRPMRRRKTCSSFTYFHSSNNVEVDIAWKEKSTRWA